MMPPVIVLGHGSRSPEANAALASITDMVRVRTGWDVTHACMEISPPTLEEAVRGLAEKGHRQIVVMPFFLFQGMHVKKDIPQMLAKLAAECPGLQLEFAAHLGVDQRLADLIVERVSQSQALQTRKAASL